VLSLSTASRVSDIDGLIFRVIIPSSEISGVISNKIPANTELISSLLPCVPAPLAPIVDVVD